MGGLITFAAVPRGGVWGPQLPGSNRNRRKKERIRKEGKGRKIDTVAWTEGVNIELFLFIFLLYNHLPVYW